MRRIFTAIVLFAALAFITGVLYPALVTVLAQTLFPGKAAGSLIRDHDGTVVGSALIGQRFTDPKDFWPRPPATADDPYNPLASGGSQLGPTNPELARQVAERVKSLRESGVVGPIPADLVTASGSGLDPDVTLDAALVQVPRVARARGVSEEAVSRIVAAHLKGRTLWFLGVPRVNVVELNRALETMQEGADGQR